MPNVRRAGLALAVLMLMVSAVLPASAGELKANWKNGLSLQTEDKSTVIKLGGRIFNDWAFLTQDEDYEAAYGKLQDGTEFRTARLFVSGTLHKTVEFKAQYEMAKGNKGVEFKDVYVGLKTLPLLGAGLRVGHFKQPFGLEELTSSKYMSFMERSVTASFAPSRATGLMLHDGLADGRATWAISTYRDSDAKGAAESDDAWSFAGRATALAWMGEEEGDLLHLGLGVARNESNDDEVELALEPEAHLIKDFHALELAVGSWTLVGGEMAAVMGSFSLQGEYVQIMTHALGAGEDGSFGSFYAQGSFFVTGEKRPYKKSSATFDRVKPKENFDGEGGLGALELVARYSSTDLEDGVLDGGTLDAITAGLNWYLNPNSRVMVNYVRSDGDSPSGAGVAHAFQTRFQIDF